MSGTMKLKSGLMDKEAVMTILKDTFGHNKFRSEEQKKAVFTLIKGLYIICFNEFNLNFPTDR